MRVVKKYLLLSVLLLMYVISIAILLRSYYVFQSAYRNLSRLISHPSIEISYDSGDVEAQ